MADQIIAKYLRISREEAHTVSFGIENQRLMLDQYLADNDTGEHEIQEFVDSGFSGTNFERPAVQKLLELVREGKVACIIVKDFSRFGRNAIESGYFIERVFPLYRVRFIAVDDGYDSDSGGDGSCGMEVAFKFLINEYYCRDLSEKIRNAWLQRALSGERVSKGCVFGYKLDESRNMVIDPPAADTVRRIFEVYACERSLAAVKRQLYKEGRETPAHIKGDNRARTKAPEFSCVWCSCVIRKILRDEQYLGMYVAGKTRIFEVGSRRAVPVPEKDWIRIPGHHPAIIEQELFETVQKLLSAKKERRRERKYGAQQLYADVSSVLSGKAVCGHCGHTMSLVLTRNAAFRCGFTRAAANAACHKLRIRIDELESSVLEGIRTQASAVLDSYAKSGGALSPQSPAISEYAGRLAKLEEEKQRLYEAFVSGDIDRKEYQIRKRVVDSEIEKARQVYDAIRSDAQKNVPDAETINAARLALTDNVLSRAAVELLIDKVLVHPDHKVEIAWKHPCFAARPPIATEPCVAN